MSRTWQSRWEGAIEDLTAERAESARLRSALDELNADTEELLNNAAQNGIEAAKSHELRVLRRIVRVQRDQLAEVGLSAASRADVVAVARGGSR